MQINDLQDRCRGLRAKAPDEWAAFVQLFADYTDETVYAVTEADASSIMTEKGRAQALTGLLRAFVTLDTQASASPPSPPTPAMP